MRGTALIGLFALALDARGQNGATKLWNELKAKREAYSGIHQEFEVVRTLQTNFDRQSAKWQVVVDMAGNRWRETAAGLRSPTRVFDGKDSYSFEPGEAEYVRLKHGKDEIVLPSPYDLAGLDWAKASAQQRVSCKLQGETHECIVLELPIKPWIKNGSYQHVTQLTSGVERLVLDSQTGLLMLSESVENLQGEECTCRRDTKYTGTLVAYKTTPSPGIFVLPDAYTRQVKELPRWDAARIKKTLEGKPAPDLIAAERSGVRIELSALKGKTVLLDFWASWCPPCRADSPSLNKLYQRYGGKDMEIIAIDLAEDRSTVEKYLKEHPSGYPVVLSTENVLPLPYQPNVIPTYVVISPDGTVEGATEGTQGFFYLRDLLKKAGWDMN